MHLSSFIGETEWSEFRTGYREKRVIARPAGPAGRFRALWADWEFDAICRFTPLPDSDTFRLIAKGRQIPAAAYRERAGASLLSAVRQFRAAGATVNFARLELYSNPVLALNRSLEAALGCPSRVHFFATPPQAQGLGVHADHGDVLILQVQGQKSWDVYHGSERWPAELAPEKLKSQPPETITLSAGGWLYLPTGVYHEVRNKGDEASTHFTIGLHPLPWAAAIENALALGRRTAAELNENVAVIGRAPAEEEVERRLRALQPFVARALAAECYGHPLPPEDLPARDRLDRADTATAFAWRGAPVSFRLQPDRVEFSLPYRSGPLRLRSEFAEVLRRMAALGRFSAAELTGDPAELVLLCQFLTNLGVLRLGGPDGG